MMEKQLDNDDNIEEVVSEEGNINGDPSLIDDQTKGDKELSDESN